MFAKKTSEKIPFSDIAHIDAMTMAYVLSLREQPPDDDLMKNMSEDDKKVLEAENKPLRKGQTACKAKNCKDVTIAISMAILDGVHTKRDTKKNIEVTLDSETRINELNDEINELDEMFESINAEYSDVLKTLEQKEKKMKSLNHNKNVLEQNIKSAQRQLEKLIRQASKESSNSSVNSTGGLSSAASMKLQSVIGEEDDETVQPSPTGYRNKKHSGVFSYCFQTQRFCWSCCISEEKGGEGCMDDQSIGVLSSIGNTPFDTSTKTTTLLN